ncbi:MAG: STAS domain-containing protein [Solirubrobacteraceae bacterium]
MVRPTKFEIEPQTNGTRLTLSIAGELDMSTVDTLAQHVDRHIQATTTSLTLDLRELTFMDSSGVRLLVALSHRSEQARWQLRLIPSRHETATVVLRATGADVALPFEKPGE